MEHLLLETPAAPLKKALLEAQIGKDVFGFFESDILQPVFSIVVRNSEEDRKQEFQDIVFRTLRTLARDGIDKRLIEASVNTHEFSLREADFRGRPKGLFYCIKLMSSWLYDADPTLHLQYEPLLERIKSAFTTDYFERLIDRYLLNNSHRSLLVAKPKPGLADERDEKVRKRLAEFKASLSEEGIDKLIAQTERLRKMQQEPDPPEALATIPVLSLVDIEKKAEQLPLEQREEGGVTVLTHPMFTNKIVYANLFFDTSAVPQHLLPYIPLLTRVVRKVSTENYGYEDLANEINIHTGGIAATAQAFAHADTDERYFPKLIVKSKALVERSAKLFELLEELLLRTRFDEERRLREVIQETKSREEMGIFDRGHQVATQRVTSYFSPFGRYTEIIRGLSFYRFVADLERDFESKAEEIKENLRTVARLVFDRSNLLVSIVSSGEDYGKVRPHLSRLIEGLPSQNLERHEYSFDLRPLNEGLLTPSDVQYVAKGYNFRRLGHSYSGAMQVLRTVAGLDYLWNKIRVQGGAYGSSANFSRTGNAAFSSYRDPNLAETLAVYDAAPEYIRQFAADDREMTKYIIGTVSQIDIPLTPSMKGEQAASRFISGLTHDAVQRERDEVLSSSQKDIRAMADIVEDVMKQQYICVLGSESRIRENAELFGTLVKVFD